MALVQAAAGGFDPADFTTWASLPAEAYEDAADALNDVLISTYVTAWSIPGEFSDAANLLSREDFDTLAKACDEADRGEDFTPEAAADPKAPTDASNASEPG